MRIVLQVVSIYFLEQVPIDQLSNYAVLVYISVDEVSTGVKPPEENSIFSNIHNNCGL